MSQQTLETHTERHFYEMPATCEMYLAALCAIQDYYHWLAKRAIKAEIVLYCPSKELDFLVPAVWHGADAVVIDVRHEIDGLTLEGFDQTVQFDPELAYKLGLKTEKHVVQVFGMLVGSDPVKIIPDVSVVTDEVTADCDIMLLPFPGSDAVYEFLCNNKPELNVQREEAHFGDQWTAALRGRLIVGVRSGLTYLAASTGRAVVEIYPTDRHRNWLSKWACPLYQMIYGNPGDVPPDLVYRAIEAMWKKVERRNLALSVPVKAEL